MHILIADYCRYDRRHFTDAGMDHTEMYFDDGTNPSDEIIREFIRVSDDVIVQRKQRVAVHCRAGLGRTGVLIGGQGHLPPVRG